jgi:hypothetical protein
MVHVNVQVVSFYVTPWLSNTCLISVISFVITLYIHACTQVEIKIVGVQQFVMQKQGYKIEHLQDFFHFSHSCKNIMQPCMLLIISIHFWYGCCIIGW